MPPGGTSASGRLTMEATGGDVEFARLIATWIETAAVVVIGVTAVAAVARASFVAMTGRASGFETFKRLLARGLLVGLDLLIAGDIITTVTLDLTLENLVALGLLVVIRTFLSWTLVLEAEGRWPWHARRQEADG